jgi:hypothetical protein
MHSDNAMQLICTLSNSWAIITGVRPRHICAPFSVSIICFEVPFERQRRIPLRQFPSNKRFA